MIPRNKIVAAVGTVFDPEFQINVLDLGLIYSIDILPDNTVSILMTVAAPKSPHAAKLPNRVRRAIFNVPGVTDVRVEVTFVPAWSEARMAESAKLAPVGDSQT